VIDANAIFKLGNNVELGVEASHFHLRQNDLTPGYVYEDSRFETNSVLARLTADTDIGLLKFTAYSNWLAQRTTSVPLFGVFAFRNRTIVAQAEDVFGLGADHDLRLAVEYRHNISTTSPYLGGKVFYDVVTASGIWH
jgi:iron complex outermembrane receptor protein